MWTRNQQRRPRHVVWKQLRCYPNLHEEKSASQSELGGRGIPKPQRPEGRVYVAKTLNSQVSIDNDIYGRPKRANWTAETTIHDRRSNPTKSIWRLGKICCHERAFLSTNADREAGRQRWSYRSVGWVWITLDPTISGPRRRLPPQSAKAAWPHTLVGSVDSGSIVVSKLQIDCQQLECSIAAA